MRLLNQKPAEQLLDGTCRQLAACPITRGSQINDRYVLLPLRLIVHYSQKMFWPKIPWVG